MNKILFFIEENIKDFVIGTISLIALILACLSFFAEKDLKSIENDTSTYEILDTNEEINSSFFVEIKGAVKKPGVYEVSNKNIINDVINRAEGFLDTAYTNNINLAKTLSNEMVIYIFTKNEYKSLNNKATVTKTETCKTTNYIISDCVNKGNSVIEKVDDSKSTNDINNSQNVNKDDKTQLKMVNINTATEKELTSISGIGSAKAKAIINYREKNGLFKSIDELKNVSGIGDAIFEKAKDYITI